MGCGQSSGTQSGAIVEYPYQPTGNSFIDDSVRQGKAVLGYWQPRGRAQSIRTLLCHLQVPFVNRDYQLGDHTTNFDKSEWLNEKEKIGLPFPNLPYYIDNHTKITETMAIFVYICRKHRMEYLGRDQVEVASIVTLWNVISNIRNQIMPEFLFSPDREAKKQEAQQKIEEVYRQVGNAIGSKAYSCSQSGPTWVDFQILEDLCMLEKMFPGHLSRMPPPVKRVYDNVLALPHVQQECMNSQKTFFGPLYPI